MRIAVSACLLGHPCRFDGAARPCAAVQALAARHELVPVCPEQLGGLPTPRPPSEIDAAAPGLRVVDADGADVTAAFALGARRTLALVQAEGCELAVLKAKSPSCGSGLVYDGTFTRTLAAGDGTTVRALRAAGIPVVDETQVEGLLR